MVDIPERPQRKPEHVVCSWACGAPGHVEHLGMWNTWACGEPGHVEHLGGPCGPLIPSSHILLGWALLCGFFISSLHLIV